MVKQHKDLIAWQCPKCGLLRTNKVTHKHGVSLTKEQFKEAVSTYNTQQIRKNAQEEYEKLRGGKHERDGREKTRRFSPKRSV